MKNDSEIGALKAYEIYSESHSCIVHAETLQDAVQMFLAHEPDEVVIFAEDVRKRALDNALTPQQSPAAVGTVTVGDFEKAIRNVKSVDETFHQYTKKIAQACYDLALRMTQPPTEQQAEQFADQFILKEQNVSRDFGYTDSQVALWRGLKEGYMARPISGAATGRDWISVKERTPDDDEKVLVWESKFGRNKYSNIQFGYYYNEKWHIESNDSTLVEYYPNSDSWEITYWMPLHTPDDFSSLPSAQGVTGRDIDWEAVEEEFKVIMKGFTPTPEYIFNWFKSKLSSLPSAQGQFTIEQVKILLEDARTLSGDIRSTPEKFNEWVKNLLRG